VAAPTFHTAHARTRQRVDRDREYDDYVEREGYPHANTHGIPHHGGDDYRDRIPPRDHRVAREEEYPTHRGSSRRALNAI
jgi:hypothetical protein